jgi:hypothetical protein
MLLLNEKKRWYSIYTIFNIFFLLVTCGLTVYEVLSRTNYKLHITPKLLTISKNQ